MSRRVAVISINETRQRYAACKATLMKLAAFDPPRCRTTCCIVGSNIVPQSFINVVGDLQIAKGSCMLAHLLTLTEQPSMMCGNQDRRLSAMQLEKFCYPSILVSDGQWITRFSAQYFLICLIKLPKIVIDR